MWCLAWPVAAYWRDMPRGFFEKKLDNVALARDVLSRAWGFGCRDSALISELAGLVMRQGRSTLRGRQEATHSTPELPPSLHCVVGSVHDPDNHSISSLAVAPVCASDAARSESAHTCSHDPEDPVGEAFVTAVSFFEQALDPTKSELLPADAPQLWHHYVDFLLYHGAPVGMVRAVQARMRSFIMAGKIHQIGQATRPHCDGRNKKRLAPSTVLAAPQASTDMIEGRAAKTTKFDAFALQGQTCGSDVVSPADM